MLIYQVLDEQNNPVAEYTELGIAIHDAEDLTLWHEDHYYHVEPLSINE